MRLLKNKKRQLNNQGFTLIEVILSIVILSLVTIPLMKYFQDSLRYSKLTEERQRATLMAQQTVETMKSEDTLILHVQDLSDASKLIYGIPAMTTRDSFIITKKPDTFEEDGKGLVELAKKVQSGDMEYEVFVTLNTNVAANAVQRASIYGINDEENVMVVEQTQEMDALWYFLQLNNSYVVSQQGFAGVLHSHGDDEEEDDELTEDDDSDEEEGPTHHTVDDVEMYEDINEIREILQRDIYITIGKESVDPFYYTVKVEYVYSCKEKIADGAVGTDTFSSGEIVNDRIRVLSGVYLMYNIVDPDTDKIHIVWDSSVEPTDIAEVPEIILVCQNLDSLIGSATELPVIDPDSLAAGELAPVYFQRDAAVITVDCLKADRLTQALNGYEPTIRTNFKSTVAGVTDKAQIMLGAASYPRVQSLTAWDTPVRIVDIVVDVYKLKDGTDKRSDEDDASYITRLLSLYGRSGETPSDEDIIISVHTSKGE